METNSEQNLELEEAEKKLSEFRSRLNTLVQDVWTSKNIDTNAILSAINELQSLIQWAAQQPELGEESVVLLVKLQELHRLRQNLENVPVNKQENNTSEILNSQENEILQRSENFSKEPDAPDNVVADLLKNDNGIHNDVVSAPKEPISHVSELVSRTEEANETLCEEINEMVKSGDEDSWNLENVDPGLNNKERCSDSTEDAVMINSDTEFQDLLLSSDSDHVFRSDTEIQDSPTTEYKRLSKGDSIEENLPQSEMLTNINTEMEDSTLVEVKNLSEANIKVEGSVQDNTKDSNTSNAEEDPQNTSNDSEALLKSPAEKEDTCQGQVDVAVKITSDVHDVPASETSVSVGIQVFPVSNTEDSKESISSSQNLVSKVVKELTESNTEFTDFQSVTNETAKENGGGNLDWQSTNNVTAEENNAENLDSQSIESKNLKDFNEENLDLQTVHKTVKDNKEEELDVDNRNSTEHGSTETFHPQSVDSETTTKVSSVIETSNAQSVDIETTKKNTKSVKKEVRILETNEENKTIELDDTRNSNDPLDVCMFAIRNLYDSLRTKENELLKLSVMQSDQKHIEALQSVIIDFHKDVTNLNSQLDKTKKENTLLKEQVLELEEAENDARLEAQKLGQKLAFLQEKDSHSQAELHQLKVSLKKHGEKFVEKESVEKELRSQIKYLEALALKYEEQIKVLEAKVVTLTEQIPEPVPEKEVSDDAVNTENIETCGKGTQTYVPCEAKVRYSKSNILHETDSSDSGDLDASANESARVIDESQVLSCDNPDSFTAQNASVEDKEEANPEDQAVSGPVPKLTQKELVERLHKLVDDDVTLQQQIHSLDQINLDLWKKLQNLENNIGECKRKDINETDLSVNNTERKDSFKDVTSTENADVSTIIQENYIPGKNLTSLDQNEQCIQERLSKLEEINESFEKELKTRENLCKEKEKKCEEWMQTEKRLMADLKRLSEEKDNLADQVAKLKKEKEVLEKRLIQQQSELKTLKEKNEKEIVKMKSEQDAIILQHQHKVNSLQTKEKELLKMITKLKSERNRNENKSELERLKGKYIELQLELSNSRDEIEKLEEKFKNRLHECVSKHLEGESKLITILECLRKENERCDKIIKDLEGKQQELLKALDRQGNELKIARESYKKTLEDTEEVHRSVETKLKNQLQQIEESTVVAATALMEERVKAEKEFQENIVDLRAKEEAYKAKIAELEQNVVGLREELQKASEEAQLKIDTTTIQENLEDTKADKTIAVAILKIASSMPVDSEIVEKPVEKSLKASTVEAARCSTPTIPTKPQLPRELKSEKTAVGKVQKEENVDQLRAQVRELQAQLERISGEPDERPKTPLVQPVTPISAPSMGLKKEDIDYAEVDDCLDAWRKPSNPTSSNKPQVPLQYQPVYKNRYESRYKQSSTKQKAPPVQQESEDNDYDEVLPRPTNFHVVQQVGSDTLLVGWNYVNPSLLDGFEVYLDNQVHERIYIPDRTKALISGLNLRRPIHLSICALSRYGQISEPAVLDLPPQSEINEQYFEDEDEEEYRDFENSMYQKQRPYSMEW